MTESKELVERAAKVVSEQIFGHCEPGPHSVDIVRALADAGLLADPAQTPGPNKPTHPLPARSYQEVADIVCNLSTLFIAARDRRALTTRAVAQQLDVAPSTVSRLESGFYPSVEVAMRVLEWLEEDCPTCRADAHVLADPAQTTEREKLRAQRDAAQSSSNVWKQVAEQWEQGHQNTVLPYTTKLEEQRDALSLLLRGMARKLVAYRKWMSGDDVPVVHRLRREAEERQARIDAALVECDREYPIGRVPIDEVPSSAQICDRIRAALVDDQPTAHALIEERDDAAEDVDHG